MKLLSKVQDKNFEPGEFTDVQERTCDETLQLIENYPWESQREQTVIGLTNSSVTIEGFQNDFLKLTLFYNGKFILYYFNARKELFSLSLLHYQDASDAIRSFFKGAGFDHEGFKKETTWFRNNAPHFYSQPFEYRMNAEWRLATAAAISLFSIGWIVLLISLFLSDQRTKPPHILLVFSLLFLFFLIRLGALFINHYKSAIGKTLVLSRGQDRFQYGPEDAQKQYDKKDIREVITYGRRGKYGYSRLVRVEISFKDGSSIDLSCLIIAQEKLLGKFKDIPSRIVKKTFPFIPRQAPLTSI